ncbi:sigma-54-dependent Fis family transcriptional regulator [Echinicola strongylocentroti]|uniref:Sigma-54-dependent Fis family transcriptional regulator n=1 Tax=Echinicola strongylocentroti TaxID=1795355 RepID=A0A2Z4IM34_9BACT|nr:sigma-54 dependent transcriptional regulator [Echinicola strongylocentroti]AWW32015.1 sigma-54-dependent Fis family transcriptional regulator [Echinicola strongylocentroti]
MESILIVDNQVSVCNLLKRYLTDNGYTVDTSTQATHAIQLMKDNHYQFVISDYRLPKMEGNVFFHMIKSISPKSRVIFTSNQVNLKNVVNMIREGASSYLAKPLNPDELVEVLKQKPRSVPSPSASEKKEAAVEKMPDYVNGESKRAKEVEFKVGKVGPTNFSVILEGETGTGKESYARLIHHCSERKEKPFVAVDCGCLSRELAGSELFGHEKGAFTGAVTHKTGFFEMANGGTIFLDEIANLSSEIQMALLRALQEKIIRKVGGTKEIPIDVRIIAATNEDLFSKSGTTGFREDLFYRLSEFVLKVPPLRERGDDIYQFIDFFLKKTTLELGQKETPRFTDEAMACLVEYQWPGNIRELKNAIRRASLFANSKNLIPASALPEMIRTSKLRNASLSLSREGNSEPVGKQEYNERKDLKSVALMAESEKIKEVLEDVKYNKTKAAQKLNIHRKTLYSKLKALNISY